MKDPLPVNILLVDDQPNNLMALEAILAGLGQNLVRAGSGAEALKQLLKEDFSLVLLDVQMPGMDGLETATLIRQRDKDRHLPIIFLTAHERDNAEWLRGYALGAVDFLFKPIIPDVLRAKARFFVELEHKNRQILQQAEQLRESQQREIARQLAEEKQRWEVERLRDEAARERENADELSRRQQELTRLYREIQQSNRRKDEFLAMLAHELRNPLAPLRNALHILHLGGRDGPNAEQARQMAERQVGHLARLVDDLLDVSRISRGQIALNRQSIDLAEVVARAVESTRPAIENNNHRLELTVPPGPIDVEADPLRIEQVLVNLLHNAAKYTPPGGQIWLTVAMANEGHESSGKVEIRVRDTGVGIAPDLLPAVFDLFVQANRSLDRSQGGLGIGLTLVKNLVELHGGTVEAHSEGPDRGSEFVVRLPRRTQPRTVSESATVPGGVSVSSSRRVLVVDDNVDAAESLVLLLKCNGHEARVSHDGRDALENARDWAPEVILLDIGLPHVNGYEVVRQLREDVRFRKTLIIAVTGYGQEKDRRLSREAGFDAHLTKPIDLAELQTLLTRSND